MLSYRFPHLFAHVVSRGAPRIDRQIISATIHKLRSFILTLLILGVGPPSMFSAQAGVYFVADLMALHANHRPW